MTESVASINGVTIELTDERWGHITDGHPEIGRQRKQVLSAVQSPDRVLEGGDGALMAVKRSGARGWLVVVYKERGEEGFIITAFRTTRTASLDRRNQIWP